MVFLKKLRNCFFKVIYLTILLIYCVSSDQLQLKLTPIRAEVEVGQNVTLFCELDRQRGCDWSKDDDTILTYQKGVIFSKESHSSCTLTFILIAAKDFGSYQCFSRGSSDSHPSYSTRSLVMNKGPFKQIVTADATGRRSTLSCYFTGNSNCVWYGPGSDKQFNIYTPGGFNEIGNYTNCSLLLNYVLPNQTGEWECTNQLRKVNYNLPVHNSPPISTTSASVPENSPESDKTYIAFIVVPVIICVAVVVAIVAYIIRRFSVIANELRELKEVSTGLQSPPSPPSPPPPLRSPPPVRTIENPYTDLTEDGDVSEAPLTEDGYMIPIECDPRFSPPNNDTRSSPLNNDPSPCPTTPMSQQQWPNWTQRELMKKQLAPVHHYDQINNIEENC